MKSLAEVDETTAATLRFGDGQVATFVTSFNAADVAAYRIVGTKRAPSRRSGVRVRRGAGIHADDRREDTNEEGWETGSVRAGARCIFLIAS